MCIVICLCVGDKQCVSAVCLCVSSNIHPSHLPAGPMHVRVFFLSQKHAHTRTHTHTQILYQLPSIPRVHVQMPKCLTSFACLCYSTRVSKNVTTVPVISSEVGRPAWRANSLQVVAHRLICVPQVCLVT